VPLVLKRLHYELETRPVFFIVLCGVVSWAFLNLLYLGWSPAIQIDVKFPMSLAQIASATGRWVTMEPNARITEDLGTLNPEWLTSWPPGIPALFFLLLKAGLTPGAVATVVGSLCVLATAIGWTLVLRAMGTATVPLLGVALVLPWTSFLGFAMTVLFNDHVLVAMAPWVFLMLLTMPDTDKLRGWRPWTRLFCAAFATGLLVIFKYSAFPLLVGAGLFFLTRDSWLPRSRTLIHALPFTLVLILPGLCVYALNEALSGQAAVQLSRGFQLNAVGIQQVWDLFGPPMSAVLGWQKLSSHWPVLGFPCELLGFAALVSTVYASRQNARSTKACRLLWLLCVMTITVCGFLFSLTVVLPNDIDWTSDPRYYFPVFIGWLALSLLCAFRVETPRISRLCLATLCVIPILYSIASISLKTIIHDAPLMLPSSHLAWDGAASDTFAVTALHSKLISDREKPVFLIGNPLLGNELGIPALPPWLFSNELPFLQSSKKRTVWAVLDTSETTLFAQRLRGAHYEIQQLSPESSLRLTTIHFN
jgi:hypothetical protein